MEKIMLSIKERHMVENNLLEKFKELFPNLDIDWKKAKVTLVKNTNAITIFPMNSMVFSPAYTFVYKNKYDWSLEFKDYG